ncbi:MAG: peptidoglycan editing factor PgeF [Cellulosilyticaceae bacterium]
MNEKQKTLLIEDDLPRIIFKQWSNFPDLVHCFTTKNGGVSKGDCATLNLGFNNGDDYNNVIKNYKCVADALDIDMPSMVLSNQTHEDNIIYVEKDDCGNGIIKPNMWQSIDGMYTNQKGITLVTHYADCVPLFFYAPKYGMIGLAHAGWRGTVLEIGAKMVDIWHKNYKIPYDEIQVGIGPSIGACCFEVNSDVSDVFIQKFGFANFIKESKTKGKYNIDLWECNKQSLLKIGIKEENILSANRCTCCEHEIFHSHRYTKGKRGTLGAFIALK